MERIEWSSYASHSGFHIKKKLQEMEYWAKSLHKVSKVSVGTWCRWGLDGIPEMVVSGSLIYSSVEARALGSYLIRNSSCLFLPP